MQSPGTVRLAAASVPKAGPRLRPSLSAMKTARLPAISAAVASIRPRRSDLPLAVEVHRDQRLVPRREPRDEDHQLLRAIGDRQGRTGPIMHSTGRELLRAEAAESRVDNHLPDGAAEIDESARR
jgi:hypothetical protein